MLLSTIAVTAVKGAIGTFCGLVIGNLVGRSHLAYTIWKSQRQNITTEHDQKASTTALSNALTCFSIFCQPDTLSMATYQETFERAYLTLLQAFMIAGLISAVYLF